MKMTEIIQKKQQWLEYYLDPKSETFFNQTKAARKVYPHKTPNNLSMWGTRLVEELSGKIDKWIYGNLAFQHVFIAPFEPRFPDPTKITTERLQWLEYYLDSTSYRTFLNATQAALKLHPHATYKSVAAYGYRSTRILAPSILAWLRKAQKVKGDKGRLIQRCLRKHLAMEIRRVADDHRHRRQKRQQNHPWLEIREDGIFYH